jgi:hypothetical protein
MLAGNTTNNNTVTPPTPSIKVGVSGCGPGTDNSTCGTTSNAQPTPAAPTPPPSNQTSNNPPSNSTS